MFRPTKAEHDAQLATDGELEGPGGNKQNKCLACASLCSLCAHIQWTADLLSCQFLDRLRLADVFHVPKVSLRPCKEWERSLKLKRLDGWEI